MAPRSLLPAASLALALVPWPSAALAAPAPSANPPAKVRVSVDTDFFGFTHYDPANTDLDGTNTNVVGFGLGRPTLIDGGDRGLGGLDRSVLGIGVGGLLLQGRVVVGARLAFTIDGALRNGRNDTAVGGRFVPYFEYMFGPYGRLRPYVGAHVGFGGSAITFEDDFGGAIVRARTSVIYPVVGPQGGVHVFLVDRVSLDAGLTFDYLAPFDRTVQIEPEPPAGEDESYDKSSDVFNVAVTLGLSAWF